MKILCECNLVKARREGKWSHYSLNRDALEAFRSFMTELSGDNGKGSGDPI